MLVFEWERNKVVNPHNTQLIETVKREGLLYTLCYKVSMSTYFHRRNPINKVVSKLQDELSELIELLGETKK